MTKEELVQAFRTAVDYEKRFGYRTDIPEVKENWFKVVELLYKLVDENKCHKKTLTLKK